MDVPKGPWMSPKLVERPSPIQGRGLFALGEIEEGEVLVVWGGLYVDSESAKTYREQGRGTMRWDIDLFSVESDTNHPAFNVNHSCDGNAVMAGPFLLIARRPIKKGEEITADYALWSCAPDYVSAWQCHCGSPLCRGKVTGNDWQDPVLQARYEGGFSPLVSSMIASLNHGR